MSACEKNRNAAITQEISYNCDYGDNTFNLAIDIGGTLAKVVFSPIHSNRLMFYTIETEKIDKLMELLHSIIKEHNNGCYRMTHIIATGGGAFKFYDLLYENFPQIKGISRFEEMEGLIQGLDFFIHEIPDEVFTYNDQGWRKDNTDQFRHHGLKGYLPIPSSQYRVGCLNIKSHPTKQF